MDLEELGVVGVGVERRGLLRTGGGRGGAFLLNLVPWDGLGFGEVVAEVDVFCFFNWDNGVLESVDGEEDCALGSVGLVSVSGVFLFFEGFWVLGAISRIKYSNRIATQNQQLNQQTTHKLSIS